LDGSKASKFQYFPTTITVKEQTYFVRYPSFIDAVRDLDDCLCHLFLFATLPSTDLISVEVIEDSKRLAAEFMNFVIQSKSLKKTFLSIKGIYYQAEIKGQEITWLVPYEFSVPIPHDVDLKVMLTFLEFYRCLMGFINFKLYSEINLKYPPVATEEVVQEDVLSEGQVQAVEPVDKKKLKDMKRKAMRQVKSLNQKLSEIASSEQQHRDQLSDEITQEVPQEVKKEPNPLYLFSNKTFYVSREVPRYSVDFVLRAFDGKIAQENSECITHVIVDRPVESLVTLPGRIYVQPQWIYDCINAGMLLDELLYAPGKSLPPHLSPFKAYHAAEEADVSESENEIIEGESDVEEEVDEIVPEESAELKLQKQKKEEKHEEKEKVERAKMLMSNKKRKFVERIQEKQSAEIDEQRKLRQKRRAIAKK
jgi:pescadillo